MVEVVIALTIAALGLGFLMTAASTGFSNTNVAYQYIEATRRAQSRLATVGTIIPLRAGEQTGDDGSGYTWRVRISEPLVHADARAIRMQPTLGLYNIEVGIGWRNGGLPKNVSLRSQRLGRVADRND